MENRLWSRLRELEDCRFRRKWFFQGFMIDFVEHDLGLAVVLEEGAPGSRSLVHAVRDRQLSAQGYAILRLCRSEAARDLSATVQRIRAVLDDLSTHGPV